MSDRCEASGKICYASPQKAWSAARKMLSRKKKRLEGHAYLCRECRFYHFTHSPNGAKER